MLRPSTPNHGTLRLPNDDDDLLNVYMYMFLDICNIYVSLRV